jgi:hypothetical protein
MSDASAPRMTNPPSGDDDDEGWAEILELEREFAAEAEPAPVTKWETTEQMLAELGKIGLDASKLKLPSRTWTPDEAFEALAAVGVTGNHFSLPGDPPKRLEDRLYPNHVRK